MRCRKPSLHSASESEPGASSDPRRRRLLLWNMAPSLNSLSGLNRITISDPGPAVFQSFPGYSRCVDDGPVDGADVIFSLDRGAPGAWRRPGRVRSDRICGRPPQLRRGGSGYLGLEQARGGRRGTHSPMVRAPVAGSGIISVRLPLCLFKIVLDLCASLTCNPLNGLEISGAFLAGRCTQAYKFWIRRTMAPWPCVQRGPPELGKAANSRDQRASGQHG